MQFTQGVLTTQYFNTEDSSLKASFKLDASIKAPTVIYQNSQYWCGDACTCSYSESGTALPADSYTAVVSGQITELTVTDSFFNGKTINVACSKDALKIV